MRQNRETTYFLKLFNDRMRDVTSGIFKPTLLGNGKRLNRKSIYFSKST